MTVQAKGKVKRKLRKKADVRREQERRKKNRIMVHVLGSAAGWWKELVVDIILEFANSGEEFTADDVRMELQRRKTPQHWPNAMGPMFNSVAAKGWIVKTGNFRATDVPNGNARSYPFWIGV